MANVTQATGLRLLREDWRDQVQYGVNNVRGWTKAIYDTKEEHFGQGGYKIHWPIVGAITASALSGTFSVTYTANTETESVITPTVAAAGVLIQEDVALTSVVAAPSIYGPALAEAVYQKIDADGLALHASYTTNNRTDAADFTEATFQALVADLLTNGGDKVMLGNLTGFYHPAKWDAIMQIGNFTNAMVRGENNGPAKTGVIGTAYGVNFVFTKNVVTSTTLRNVIVAPMSTWLARKNYPKIEMERSLSDLGTKVVASTMYGVGVLHQVAGACHIITTTG